MTEFSQELTAGTTPDVDGRSDPVIAQLQKQYRACRSLQAVGGVWLLFGAMGYYFFIEFNNSKLQLISLVLQMVGLGILSSAVALTYALYRCPKCDKPIVGFGPDLRQDRSGCRHCGARIR